MTGNTNRQTGFTLIEVLVSTAVIGIVVVIAVQLLLIFFEVQQETRDILYLEGNARNTLALIAERTRHGYVDYGYYAGAPKDEPEYLALRNMEDALTVFRFYDHGFGEIDLFMCDDAKYDADCPKLVDPSLHPNWDQVNDGSIRFDYGSFLIFPDDPPYLEPGVLIPSVDVVPTIQIFMKMRTEETLAETPHIQTGFVTRIYVR
ncbi:MAG: prepilin-type N-terminal cleavage/methylation domain-containing protein [Candidatus Kerfeldbacteria bacterium]